MKVAVAGTGPVARYLIEEFERYGHDVVTLSRRQGQQSRQTDYSVVSLVEVLNDRDALVSTVADYENTAAATQTHLNMIEACRKSSRCKTFIPSEWTLNVEEYPEQPMFFAEHNKTLHDALRSASDIRWTIVCNSWFAEYVIPQQQRHLRDLGDIWPMNYASKVFTIYGPGTQLVDFTSVRDVARAAAVLLDSKEPWEPFTYVSGSQLSWNELFAIIKKQYPDWTSRRKPLADSIRLISENASPESVLAGYFEIQGYAGALELPKEKVQSHRSKYFSDLHFHTVEEVLDGAARAPNEIV